MTSLYRPYAAIGRVNMRWVFTHKRTGAGHETYEPKGQLSSLLPIWISTEDDPSKLHTNELFAVSTLVFTNPVQTGNVLPISGCICKIKIATGNGNLETSQKRNSYLNLAISKT